MIKARSILGLVLLLFLFSGKGSYLTAKEFSLPLKFNFASSGTEFEDYININPETSYTKKAGYGLLDNPEVRAYDKEESFFLNDLTGSGLAFRDKAQFRIDLSAGNYFLEIFLDGGEKSTWDGKVSVNNKESNYNLFRYERDAEGTSPPENWFIMIPVNNREDQLMIEILSADRLVGIAAMTIYPEPDQPIKWIDGIIVTDSDCNQFNCNFIIELINKGKVTEAGKLIEAIPQEFAYEKSLLLMALAGRLETENPRPLLEWASALLTSDIQKSTNSYFYSRIIEMYTSADEAYKMAGWDWATKYSDEGIFSRMDNSARIMQTGAGLSTFLTHRFLWELGKISFWAWVEEHSDHTKVVWEESFQYLENYYPDLELLKEYMGKNEIERKLPYADEVLIGKPEWVSSSLNALHAIRELQYYWIDNRQARNGEFGGKFDDDVEMLRWWPITRLALDDKRSLVGMQKLVNGIWNSDWIYDGFSRKLRDVEHSSEPVADTQPMMIGLDYGNPVYVERCMISLRKARDLWTAENDYGHLHFKSAWYSSTEIDTTAPKNCDVGMNTRTVKAIRWFTWYNNHPLGKEFLVRWADSWLEDCYRTDKGKPYGVVPPAIRFSDDAIGGHSDNWYDSGMFWSYFNFRGGANILQQFLSTYLLTGDEKYLEPVKISLGIAQKYKGDDFSDAEPGSEKWVAGIYLESANFWEVAEQWRLISSDTGFDDLLMEHGTDYLKFRLTCDQQMLSRGSKEISTGIYNNFNLLTTEGYYTDRIEVGDLHKNEDQGVGHIESMYLGSTMSSGFYPFYRVSWSGFSDLFASLTYVATDSLITSSIYIPRGDPQKGAVHFWNLEPGKYLFKQTLDESFSGNAGKMVASDTLEVMFSSCSKEIVIQPGENNLIHLSRLDTHIREDALADLAITEDELEIEEADGEIIIRIPIHNIGISNAVDFKAGLFSGNKLLKEIAVDSLEAPLDLYPRITEIEFTITASQFAEDLILKIDPEHKIHEITEVNNMIMISN